MPYVSRCPNVCVMSLIVGDRVALVLWVGGLRGGGGMERKGLRGSNYVV